MGILRQAKYWQKKVLIVLFTTSLFLSKYIFSDDLWMAVKRNEVGTAREILRSDQSVVNAHFAGHKAETLLSAAIERGNTQMVKLLLQYGADPNLKRRKLKGKRIVRPRSPLFIAVQHGCLEDDNEIVKLLLEYEAKPDIRNEEGNTPVHLAASFACLNILRTLFDHGADSCIKNKAGKNARDIILQWENYSDTVDLLEVVMKNQERVEVLLRSNWASRLEIEGLIVDNLTPLCSKIKALEYLIVLLDKFPDNSLERRIKSYYSQMPFSCRFRQNKKVLRFAFRY